MVAKNLYLTLAFLINKNGEWGGVWLYSLLIDGLDVRGDSHGACYIARFQDQLICQCNFGDASKCTCVSFFWGLSTSSHYSN
ncbi:unnamed protein product [Arabidopsis halleri]